MHIVKKSQNGRVVYLYIQEMVYDKEAKISRAKHVAYLGRADKFTDEQIRSALNHYENKKTRKQKWRH